MLKSWPTLLSSLSYINPYLLHIKVVNKIETFHHGLIKIVDKVSGWFADIYL